MVTTLLEMCFANTQGGAEICLDELSHVDLVTALYSENPGVILQVSKAEQAKRILEEYEIAYADLSATLRIGKAHLQERRDHTARRDVVTS